MAFVEEDIKKISEIIEENFDCITDIDYYNIELDPEDSTIIEFETINADDREDDLYDLDNNTHNLQGILKEAGYDVFKPKFDRRDAYPDGTSSYSVTIELQ